MKVVNLVEGMWILFPEFSLVCLHKVLALSLKFLSGSAFVRIVPDSKLGKSVVD